MTSLAKFSQNSLAEFVTRCSTDALTEELATYPKPGLVSFIDHGSHPDMEPECFQASIAAIAPYLGHMADAGSEGCELVELQRIGIAAEEAMLAATRGRNTHRGAIYCLGLLAAAAGRRMTDGQFRKNSLGAIVMEEWGPEILLPRDLLPMSQGLKACHRHRLSGIRGEAKRGFPAVFEIGLPAFQSALPRVGRAAARVHTFFKLMRASEDTTLWHRGGEDGYLLAQKLADKFLRDGSVFSTHWWDEARKIHRIFVEHNLTAGGTADLLAATLFVHALQGES